MPKALQPPTLLYPTRQFAGSFLIDVLIELGPLAKQIGSVFEMIF